MQRGGDLHANKPVPVGQEIGEWPEVLAIEHKANGKMAVGNPGNPTHLEKANNLFHKVGVASKAVDTGVNALRFIAESNMNNTVKVGTDVAQLYGMSYGFTKLSLPLAAAPVVYQLLYQGDYEGAAIGAGTSLAFMAIPLALSYNKNPLVGLLYTSSMTAYAAYSAFKNAYSFYQEDGFQKVWENTLEFELNKCGGELHEANNHTICDPLIS